jgi:hypothetical protein
MGDLGVGTLSAERYGAHYPIMDHFQEYSFPVTTRVGALHQTIHLPGGANCVDENDTGNFRQRSPVQPISSVCAQLLSGELGPALTPRASCHEQRNLLLHGDHPSMHTLTRHCPSISPRLAKTLGRSMALHGTDLGPYLSRHLLDSAIFRWCQRIFNYMCKL